MKKVMQTLENEIQKTKERIIKFGEEEAEIRQRNHQGEDLFDEWIHANEVMKDELINLRELERVKDFITPRVKKTGRRGRPKKNN